MAPSAGNPPRLLAGLRSLASYRLTYVVALALFVAVFLLPKPHWHAEQLLRPQHDSDQQKAPAESEHQPPPEPVKERPRLPSETEPLPKPTTVNQHSNAPLTWSFDPVRDSNDHGLTTEQCESAFPGLFDEIDRKVAQHRSRPVTEQQMTREGEWPWGTVKVLIWDQQIYVLGTWNWEIRASRVFSTLHSLNKALIASRDTEKLPNIEFVMSIEDFNIVPELPLWAYDRKYDDENTWLMPDFGFYAWPEPGIGTYSEVRRRMADVERGRSFADKIPKLIWRGAVTKHVAPVLRQEFLDHTLNQPWADVKVLDWKAEDDAQRNRLNIEEHCKYRYIQHTAGRAWSGRLKFVQNCNSVIVAHDLEWVQHHQHLLRSGGPDQNYVLVRRDFSDLSEKMQFLIDNPHEAERIANNSVNAFRDRYITPAAEACYWRKLVRGWREISWEPKFYKDDSNKERNWRGVPFESFALMRTLEWEPE